MTLAGRSLTTLADLSAENILEITACARDLRLGRKQCNLFGKHVLGLFMAPSLRTRVSFEKAVSLSGGKLIALSQNEIWTMTADEGHPMYGASVENAKDAARSLSEYADLIALRHDPRLDDFESVREEGVLKSFVKYATRPVLNLGSAMHRPLQAMADLLTIENHFHELAGKRIAVVWTYHPQALNMASPNSMIEIAGRFGMHIYVAHPPDYGIYPMLLEQCQRDAQAAGGSLTQCDSQRDALEGADVVFACSWGARTFYGNWDQEKLLREKLKDWAIDDRKMRLTKDARFMFPLPVRRNIAASDDVIDAHYSLIYEQAANLQAVQQAALANILSNYAVQ